MQRKLLFIITKGFEKAGGATRAFEFATLTAKNGNAVEIFLVDDAIHWGQLGMADGIRSFTGDNMKELIDELAKMKAPVYVCQACAEKRLVTEDDLIFNAEIAPASALAEKMADEAYRVFTF